MELLFLQILSRLWDCGSLTLSHIKNNAIFLEGGAMKKYTASSLNTVWQCAKYNMHN